MAISWLKGLIRVREDLFGETFSLFEVSHPPKMFKYCLRLAAAVWSFGCWDLTVSSSAYDNRCVFGSEGRGRSCINRLKSVWTLFVKYLVGDGLPFYSVYASLPERKLASHFLKVGCMFMLRIFWTSRWCGTVSKALLMSIAANIDLCAGFRWIKPSVLLGWCCLEQTFLVFLMCCRGGILVGRRLVLWVACRV